MPRVSHFRELLVWQRGIGLVVAVYRLSGSFPKNEMYGLTSQIRRAAVSVPSNIAEGHTRESTRDYLSHISVAQASLAEVETHLEVALRLEYSAEPEVRPVFEECTILGKQLYKLRDALKKRL